MYYLKGIALFQNAFMFRPGSVGTGPGPVQKENQVAGEPSCMNKEVMVAGKSLCRSPMIVTGIGTDHGRHGIVERAWSSVV